MTNVLGVKVVIRCKTCGAVKELKGVEVGCFTSSNGKALFVKFPNVYCCECGELCECSVEKVDRDA